MLFNTVLRHPEDEGGGGDDLEAVVDAGMEGSPEPEPAGPLTLDDEAEIAWDGLEKPLTGREIREGYLRQSDYTRKTQELANRQQEFEKAQQERDRAMQYARQLEAHLQKGQQQPQQQQKDALTEVWQAITQQGGIPTDRELKALYNHIQTHGIDSIREQIKQQQGQFQYVLQDYMGTKKQLQELMQDRTVQSQKSAIDAALKEANVPDEVRDIAQELAEDMFHSFEPDKSKGETMETYMTGFPSMFADRWGRFRQVARKLDKSDLDRAKKMPGRGGNAAPSKPVKPEMDIEKIADMFPVGVDD